MDLAQATLTDQFIPDGWGTSGIDGSVRNARQDLGGDSYRGGLVENFRMIPPGESQRNWIRLRRPYYDAYDRPCVTINYGRWTTEKGERRPVLEKKYIGDLIRNNFPGLPPVTNATSLRKEEWDLLDSVVLRAARYRLRLWSDIASRNSYGGFNGMSKLVLEHETQSDPGEAIVDMDALTEGRTDTPTFQLQGLPLPITHSDFWTSSRFLGVSRNSGTPFDVNMGEAASRRVAECIEKTSIGVATGLTFPQFTQSGGYGRANQVYGLINFPARNVSTTLHNPSLGGWTPSQTLADVLSLRQTLYNNKFTGPYIIYHTNDWDQYLDNDYILTGGNVATQTLRNRLRSIEGIEDVRRLDFWFGSTPTFPNNTSGLTPPGANVDVTLKPYSLLLVQMTPDVIRAVNGMDITTIQWESVGGMRLNFKVMCIQVPQVRADFYSECGIIHATNS